MNCNTVSQEHLEGWKKIRIGELGEVVSGGTPSTKIEEYYGGSISWITPKDLSGYEKRYIYKGERNITEKGLNNSSAKILPKGTVLFSSRAPIGYVAIAGQELATNQGFKNIICNPKIVNNHFMYYKLKTLKEHFESIAGGSTFKEVSGKIVKEQEILLPPLHEQEKIVRVLTALDDKIELNTEINQTLEEMAQAIFKRWFVDFEFPNENGEPYKSSGGKLVESELGMIPEGWKVGNFRNLTENVIGGDWGKESPQGNYIKEVYCLRGTDIPEISIGRDGALPKRYILERNFNNKKLNNGDLVVEISGGSPTQSTGRITYVNEEVLSKFQMGVVCTNFCRAINLINKKFTEFFYFYWKKLYDERVFFQYENGTTGIKNLDINSFLDKYMIVIPDDSIIQSFHSVTSTFLRKIQENGIESKKLATIRDTLLPKLMSGEIRVVDAEREVEACLQKSS